MAVHSQNRTQFNLEIRIPPKAPTEETPIREFVRPVAAVLSIACLATSMAVVSPGGAWAQAKQQMAPAQAAPPQEAPVKQMALTEKQVQSVLAAQKDMDAITEKLPDNAQPDPKTNAQLEGVAKKNGFASYDEDNNVVDNISLVLAGFDPRPRRCWLRRLDQKADRPGPGRYQDASQGQEGSARRPQRGAEGPGADDENKGNIDLVAKYYDKLADAMGNDEQ